MFWLRPAQALNWCVSTFKIAARIQKSHTSHISSDSFLSSSSSSSSSASSSFFFSSSFFAPSSLVFSAFSCSLSAFHFAANESASALSSHTMTLSKIVPPFTCHRSKPMKPKSAYLYTVLSSSYSGLSIFFASQEPLYAGFEMRLTDHSPLNAGLSFIGGSHSPSSSSSQSSGFLASASTMRFSVTQSSGFLSSGSSIMESSTQSDGFLSSGSAITLGLSTSQSSLMEPSYIFSPSISTRAVLSGLRINLYRWEVPS